jgi:peptide-methionine (S)-S-oxide reductase
MLRRTFVGLALVGVLHASVSSPAGAAPRAKDSASDNKSSAKSPEQKTSEDGPMPELETVTLGAGCFWCIEAVLLRVKGIESVVSGYMGGETRNPTYEQVCTGLTGHAEVVEVKFDPQKLSFDELLDVFWQLHDPTTLNRQGADVGTQYRSGIFYHTDEQREAAEKSKKKWNESGKFKNPIVTEITKASVFYAAEDYHQDYFNKNPRNPYCRATVIPKLRKLDLLKDDND